MHITRKKDGDFIFVFQRMFQSKNMCFEFITDNVLLTQREMHQLRDYFPQINEKLKEHLIKETVAYFLSHEHCKSSNVENVRDSQVFYDFHDYTNLIHSLGKCLLRALSLKITEIFVCSGCNSGYPKPDFHDCESLTNEEKFDLYFELAFYKLDWQQIAKNFYSENASDFHVISSSEFFSSLNVMSLICDVKKIYIEMEECT